MSFLKAKEFLLSKLAPPHREQFLFVCICILTFLIYCPQIFLGELLKYDDISLVSPFYKLKSLSEYVEAIKTGQVLDVQPLRDLSFWIEVNIDQALGVKTFRLTNFLIWLLLLFRLREVLRLVGVRSVNLALIFVAVHPIAVSSVAWVSSRKHLLSALFIVLATEVLLKPHKPRSTVKAVFSYAASVLSQPINILWPIWVFFQRTSEDSSAPKRIHKFMTSLRNDFSLYLGLFLFALGGGLLNKFYYEGGSFIFNQVAPKFWEGGNELSLKFLVFGRYFMQLVFPWTPSVTSYYPGHPFGLVGLVLGPLFFWFLLKKTEAKSSLLWILFLSLPLLLMTLRMTSIYGVDTYLLVPLLGFSVLVGKLADVYLNRLPRFLWVIVLGCFGIQSFIHALAWRGNKPLAERAVFVEETPASLNMLAHEYILEEKWVEAVELGFRMVQWTGYADHRSVHVLGLSLYNDPHRSWEEKYAIFTRLNRRGFPPYEQYRASMLVQMDRIDEGLQVYNEILKGFDLSYFRASLFNTEKTLDDIEHLCRIFPKKQLCPELLERVQSVRQQSKPAADISFKN